MLDANDLLRVNRYSLDQLKTKSHDDTTTTTTTTTVEANGADSTGATTSENGMDDDDDDLEKSVVSSEDAQSSFSVERPREPHPLLHVLGYLAAIAGGHVPLNGLTEASEGLVLFIAPVLPVILKLAFGIASVLVTIGFVPFLIYDTFHAYYFWARTLDESYCKYSDRLTRRRSIFKHPSTDMDQDDFDCTRWDPQPFKCTDPVKDAIFVLYVMALCALHLRERCSAQHVRNFRRYLGSHPPHFPISANDDIFRYDAKGSRFQLSMLVVIDQISYEEVREAFRRRWIEWEPKTRAVAGRRWGRSYWRVLDDEEFQLENHIVHKTVDLSKTTVAEVVSEMGSEEMNSELPQWQVWVVNSSNSPEEEEAAHAAAEPQVASNGRAATHADVQRMTYICGKWNHTYSDGVGMMTSIVTRLGDQGVSIANLPAQYRRQVPWWQVILYYTWHSIRASCECLQHFFYAAYGIPKYPAMMQATHDELKPPRIQTGRKHYSSASVFLQDEIKVVQTKVDLAFTRVRAPVSKPTVNDLFLYCLTAAWARLTDPQLLEVIVRRYLELPVPDHLLELPVGKNQTRAERLQVIIPMMCRTGVPTCMDNFTSLVPTSLPLPKRNPRSTDRETERERVIANLLRTKLTLDAMKNRNQRTTMFLITSALCKVFSGTLTERIHNKMYENMQFCSTNVAAPPIEAKFFGRVVHGLFFWPAVPTCCTGGASVVSNGGRFQMLTVLDEAEMSPALEIAQRVLDEAGVLMTEELTNHLVVKLADIIPNLVHEEFETLLSLFV